MHNKSMATIFAEAGFGNDTFLSTEVEEGENEYRIPKFIVPQQIREVYLRIWLGKRVVIVSTREGIKMKLKDKRKIKLLVGIGGEGLPR